MSVEDAITPLSPDAAVAPQLHMRLRAKIVSGDLSPGQRVSETDVATVYNVSRQPVREAFIKLAEESLVVIRPQRGTFVMRISVADVLTKRFVREAVEADLVRAAVERAPRGMVADLRREISAQKKAAKAGNPRKFMTLDEVFHRKIAQYAGAPDVSEYLESLNVQINRVRNISAREFAPEKLIEQHTAVVDLMEKGDAAEAATAMRTHLRQINSDLPTIVETYPDFFEDIEALS